MINQGPNGQIMVTYKCSAACRHCLVMSAPQQDPLLVTIPDAVRYAEEYHQLGRHIMIAGGEALLFFDHVLEMCRAISDKGIPIAFIESNGSWCRSDEIVTERLSLLRDAGVQGMFFSIDPYHQEFVPAERVCRGVREAIRLFGSEQVSAPRLTDEAAKDFETVASDPERLGDYTRQRHLYYIGRAADELAQFLPPVPLKQIEAEDCRVQLDIDHLHEIQVDPFGYVRPDLCPGVNLGNAADASLTELVQTSRVQETPLLRDLAEAGPASLLPLARQHGFHPQPTYASKCALCFDIRRHLIDQMPDAFGPPHLYQHCPAPA